MEKISGIVERITYSDEEKGFSIIKIRVSGYRELVTLVGPISEINIGSVINAEGKWVLNAKFGKQFSVSFWKETLPADVYGIEKYLGSGLIRGIGPKFAKSIVNTFGINTFEIIENEPHKLMEIPKLGRKKAETIVKSWNEQKEIKSLMIFLQSIGAGASIGRKIFGVYGKESVQKIKENPYRLSEEVYGFGFKTADKIAQSLGVDKESYDRCRAGIFYVLDSAAKSEGHCYMPLKELISKTSSVLGIDDGKIFITCDDLLRKEELISEEREKIYLPAFFYSEVGLANKIRNIFKFPRFKNYSNEEILSEIKEAESVNKIFYDDNQKKAIKIAVSSNFSVITGGAGVGKTTITKAIINIFKNRRKKVVLTAPTGRAAKRLSESSSMEAKTIHRLLEAQKGGTFLKNDKNKIIADVLIIDESSMIDVVLMHNLLKAVSESTNIIMIGDANQLPSVGPGNVLKDIVDSQFVPVINLTNIYRQAKSSNIILNSHKINDGEIPNLSTKSDSDFFFIEQNSHEKCVDIIADLCCRRLPRYYKIDPVIDIQVLSPMKKGILGTDNLNTVLQEKLNKSSMFLKRGAVEYRIGDKVMQIKNNYDKEIFNGDIGTVHSVDQNSETLEVDFDSRILKYDISELEELSLSYACTIHKSQGGEYPIVVIPVSLSHCIMLERNLLYTAVTRAKKVCILIGEKDAIFKAVQNNTSKIRYTYLSERLSC